MPRSTRESAMAEPAAATPGRWRAPWSGGRGALLRRPAGIIGVACATLVLATAVLGPACAPFDPLTISGGSLTPPTPVHPMGTDALGRDVLSGVLYGARTSLGVAALATAVALLLGTVVGMAAGYRGGLVDDVLMRLTALFQVLPRFFLVVTVVALLGPGSDRVILIIGLTSWPITARIVRGEVMATRHLDFTHAAEALGATPWHIAWHQILPNVRSTIAVSGGLLFAQILLLDATLGFLGLGTPGMVSWGMMVAQAQGFLRVAWWLALFPGLAITLAVLGVNLLCDVFASPRAAG